jgi:sulfate permease, SulP family
MTGFVMGVAILILVGKFDSIFGYDPTEFSNKVVKAADILLHPGDWDPTTTVVGVGTIVLAFGLKAAPRLDRYALVLVVVVGTLVVWVLGLQTPLISDEATIPTGLAALPIPTSLEQLPDLTMVPTLLVGAIAIAIVALAQGAGIRPAFPNPDGSTSSASKDFLGQGLGNVAGAFFQSTPTGGSLSRTAVSADGGATHRRAGYIAAATVLLLVVFLGPVVGSIPEAVIGGLLFVIGVELVIGRLPDARLAWHTGRQERLLLLVTLALALTVPLQWAIIVGAFLSLFAFVSASSTRIELRRAIHDEEGWLWIEDVPETLPSDEPLLLRYTGPNFFAYVTTMGAHLPAPPPGQPGVLVLDVGSLQEFSSTTLKHIEKYRADLAAVGSGLVLTGIGTDSRETLVRTELLERLGEGNVLADDPHVGASIELGWRRGRELLRELRAADSEG